MGLIKTGIYAGTAYAVFNKASKAYGQHEQAKSHNSYQPQQMQFQAPSRQRGVSPSGNSSYVHQHYCNGNCTEQCNPSLNARSPNSSAAQYYDSTPQQRQLEQQPEQIPSYESSRMDKRDFGDLASMVSGYMRK